jgi:hypothetical protein
VAEVHRAKSSREIKSEPADEVGARFKMVIGIYAGCSVSAMCLLAVAVPSSI